MHNIAFEGPICATQDMLSLMYFRELYQTKQNKALDGPKSPERLVFTKPPHKTLVLSMSTKGIRTLAAPPSHTEQWQGFFLRGKDYYYFSFYSTIHETKQRRKRDISMPFLHLVPNIQGKLLMWILVEKALRSFIVIEHPSTEFPLEGKDKSIIVARR